MSISQLSLPRSSPARSVPGSFPGAEVAEVAECEVCGSADMRVDEVQSGGRLLLAECDRCDHRFTLRVASTQILPFGSRSGADAITEPEAVWSRSPAKAEVATAA